jgi:hypothetical protein
VSVCVFVCVSVCVLLSMFLSASVSLLPLIDGSQLREDGQTRTVIEEAVAIGERWRSLPPDERRVFENISADDKLRYRRDMDAFQSGTHPFAPAALGTPLSSKSDEGDMEGSPVLHSGVRPSSDRDDSESLSEAASDLDAAEPAT